MSLDLEFTESTELESRFVCMGEYLFGSQKFKKSVLILQMRILVHGLRPLKVNSFSTWHNYSLQDDNKSCHLGRKINIMGLKYTTALYKQGKPGPSFWTTLRTNS